MNQYKKVSKVLLVVYFFSIDDGVGAQRSRALYNYLLEKQLARLDVITKNKFMILMYIDILNKIWKNDYDKVYISCGPFSHLLFTSLICRIFKKELVVDFRDAWSLNILTNYASSKERKTLKYYISKNIESFVYKHCYNFIVCTQGMREQYERLFNMSSKILNIDNGYDFTAFKRKEFQKNNVISFVCIGKFAEYNKEKAILTLKDIRKNVLNKDIHITFVGSNEVLNLNLVKEVLPEASLIFYPRVGYEKAMIIARSCDVGLLIIRDEEIDYGTKVFDYIGLGIPFYSHLDKNKKFFNIFKGFLFDLESLSSNFSNNDIDRFSRRAQFQKFEGILF